MKKTLSFSANPIRRINYLKTFVLFSALLICSWPRVFLEVFLRKNMGQRYFTLFFPCVIFILFVMVPMLHIDSDNGSFYFERSFLGELVAHPSKYIFLFIFLGMSIRRHFEIQNGPSVFDLEKYSLSSGEVNPFFYMIRIKGEEPTIRMIEIVLEPAACFIVGLALQTIGVQIGGWIIYWSIIYSLSSAGMHYLGDEYVMNKLDSIIIAEETTESFVKDKKPSETRGFRFPGRRPKDISLRKRIVDSLKDDDENDAPLAAF